MHPPSQNSHPTPWMSQAAWAPPRNRSLVDPQLNPKPCCLSSCAYQLSLSKQLAPFCLSAYSHCSHSLAPKVLKHCLQESPALSPYWRPELCRPCGFLPASGSRLLNPAAFSLLGSPMIIPFSFFPFPYLCTVDFPSQTRGILAEEPQGHSCLSNPIQDCLFKPEFLVWCWKKTTLSTVAQGVLPLLWSCHPQQVLAFADRHCSPQMH